MRYLIILSALLLTIAMTSQAGAVVLGLDWGLGMSPVRIAYLGQTHDVWAGGLNGYLGGTLGNPLPPNDGHAIGRVYCVDLAHFINVPTEYEVDLVSTAQLTNGGRAAWLFSHAAPGVTTGAEAAALQVALWDIVVDNGDGFSAGGFRYISGLGASAVSSASNFLALSQGKASTTGLLRPRGSYGQAMLTPVPEPATLGLFGFGLILSGLGLRRRLRR